MVARMPAKYHKFIGKHAAHPGTGKGRMAAKRQSDRVDAAE
jgi:hypothetical protein